MEHPVRRTPYLCCMYVQGCEKREVIYGPLGLLPDGKRIQRVRTQFGLTGRGAEDRGVGVLQRQKLRFRHEALPAVCWWWYCT